MLGIFQWLFCEKLKSHNCDISGHNRFGYTGYCKRCGKLCYMDKVGNWFEMR
jgi:hypothetical protein